MRDFLFAQRRQLLQDHPHLRAPADTLTLAARAAEASPVETVSIVVSCKNKGGAIEAVIDRLARQTRRPDLVVLSDDGSDDDSIGLFLRRCERAGLEHAVSVLPPGGSYRLNTVRNRGFLRCLDGLVLLIDADMMPSVVFVEAHLALHRRADRPILSVGPRFEYAFADRSGPVNFMWGNGAEGQALSRDGYVASWSRGYGAFGVARGLWDAIGRFDEAYNGNYGLDDIDFYFRLFLAGVFARCDFEGYVIHIPHATHFHAGGRDASLNEAVFCRKYGLDRSALADPLDFSTLWRRQRNWATEYEAFLTGLDLPATGATARSGRGSGRPAERRHDEQPPVGGPLAAAREVAPLTGTPDRVGE
jgi:glycosyltransferase involved in cell wall biosynthesis